MSNDVIHEGVVTTQSPAGVSHLAAMGVRWREEGGVILMPFKPSTTLDNILATRVAVLNLVTDARIFAGAVTGRKNWPMNAATRITGRRLSVALRHVELSLERVEDDPQRPALHCVALADVTHAPFMGLNRAQAAVLEGAVLVSRLRMLPPEKIDAEMAYLRLAVEKTGSAADQEAWSWLQDAVTAHRSRTSAS